VKATRGGTGWFAVASAMITNEVVAGGLLSSDPWAVEVDTWHSLVYVTLMPPYTARAGREAMAGTMPGIKVYDTDLHLLTNLTPWAYRAMPNGIAVDNRDGSYFVCDSLSNMVYKYERGVATLLTSWGITGSKPSEFNNPSDLDVDLNGWVYVADSGNDRVQVFAPPGGGELFGGNVNMIVNKAKVNINWKQHAKGKNKDTVNLSGLAAIDVHTNITSLKGLSMQFTFGDLLMISNMLPTKTDKKGKTATYKPDKNHIAKLKFKPQAAIITFQVQTKNGNISNDIHVTDTPITSPWLWEEAKLSLSNGYYYGTHLMRLMHTNKVNKVYKAWKK
jgi:hypothetical protein